MPPLDTLAEWVAEARARSLEFVADLDDEQLMVPYLPTVNPILWELCHLAYFQEYWVLRQGMGQQPARPDVDELFDSMTIAHENRWRLPMPSREDALRYVEGVRDRTLEVLSGDVDERVAYLAAYSVFHEDMHGEAFSYTRQALGYPAPTLGVPKAESEAESVATGDVEFAGGAFELGMPAGRGFCFDNEKWAHRVEVAPFAMARTTVTEGEFAAFVEDGGYERAELWSTQGWACVQAESSRLPIYWRRAASGFERRHFDRWLPIDRDRAMLHVSYHEAEAYCRWAGRRLPTEAEWEFAAAGADSRVQAWGGDTADTAHANLDYAAGGAVAASAHAAGDTPDGVRQMIGNVWEWTSTTFAPYPGFVADMYVDYSTTSFHTRKVLRGGCWATRSRQIRNTWRNYYQPSRRDVFGGFRTCAK